MTISVGQNLPDATFTVMTNDGPAQMSTDEVFAGKKVALFSVPGAFTPTCNQKHLPGFLDNYDALAEKGIERIACVSVNDVFVMDQWGKDSAVGDKILMLADGNGDFARAMEMDVDLSMVGFGTRSRRYALVADNGVVSLLNIEETPSSAEKSSATEMLRGL